MKILKLNILITIISIITIFYLIKYFIFYINNNRLIINPVENNYTQLERFTNYISKSNIMIKNIK